MPLELGVWRIDNGLTETPAVSLDKEARLEGILAEDITIASPHWMLIGRQVRTAFGGFIDLLAIDRDGKLIVIELKKDMTPREVVAQLLDYASWVQELRADDISRIFEDYQDKWGKNGSESLDAAFCSKFNAAKMPEAINDEHELVVVAAELDDSTERIVDYLTETHNVPVNAIFFRVFKDGEREYLTRAWLKDPTGMQVSAEAASSSKQWNGEYYVSFWDGFNWALAKKYNYIAAGGGEWYRRTLNNLEVGGRFWANSPGKGYLGVGIIKGRPVTAREFMIKGASGEEIPLAESLDVDPHIMSGIDSEEEYHLVEVEWLHAVDSDSQAIRETGFFGNQNSACCPRSDKWVHTVNRLKKRFGVE